jgi:uncharacterized protein with GYD domain
MLAVERVTRLSPSGRKEEVGMPLYMSQVSYTSEAWAAMTQNPEDRSEVFRRLTEAMGGTLLSWYYTFGEYDVLVIYEAPDESTAAAIVLAATSAGHLSSVRTTVVLSAEQGVETMRKAGKATYRSPGQQ